MMAREKITSEKIKCHAIVLGVSAALSLAAVTAASAAPWSVDADDAAGLGIVVAPGPMPAPAPYEGYSAYAPTPYAPAYYDYYNGAYYGDDDAVLARRAFPPGCGAGEPHC
jgi:hypothetical protein